MNKNSLDFKNYQEGDNISGFKRTMLTFIRAILLAAIFFIPFRYCLLYGECKRIEVLITVVVGVAFLIALFLLINATPKRISGSKSEVIASRGEKVGNKIMIVFYGLSIIGISYLSLSSCMFLGNCSGWGGMMEFILIAYLLGILFLISIVGFIIKALRNKIRGENFSKGFKEWRWTITTPLWITLALFLLLRIKGISILLKYINKMGIFGIVIISAVVILVVILIFLRKKSKNIKY